MCIRGDTCRIDPKTGKATCIPILECPVVPQGIFGICLEQCSVDNDCQLDEKCCSNGCGHVCKSKRNLLVFFLL